MKASCSWDPCRKLLVMLPVAILALSGPVPVRAEPDQLQHGQDVPEQMAAHETAPSTEEHPAAGSDGQKRAHSRQTKCDHNETLIDGHCVAKHADKPRRQAQRTRAREEASPRRARAEEERPGKGLCWTQDGRHFSVSKCN
jgi:hypothetical protein